MLCVCWCQAKCDVHCPLGNEVYRDDTLSVYAVDGLCEPAYCHTLCMLAAVFAGHSHHPATHVSSTFYVLTQNDRHGGHLVAFFSSVSTFELQKNCVRFLCCLNSLRKLIQL